MSFLVNHFWIRLKWDSLKQAATAVLGTLAPTTLIRLKWIR